MNTNDLPLPKSTGTTAVYDLANGDTMQVEKTSTGHYYAWCDKFDYLADTAELMRDKLRKLNAKHVGWE